MTAPERCIVCDLPPERCFELSAPRELREALGRPVVLLRCPGCGLGWWDFSGLDPARLYDDAYFQCADVTRGYDDYASLEVGLRRTARVRLRRIERILAASGGGSRPRRIFDIGCATGVFLDEARRRGWEVAGCDVSAYGVRQARSRGIDVVQADATHVFDACLEERFDAITLWDVIEHLPEPAAAIRSAAMHLRSGGVLALSTGDLGSLCARLSGRRWHLFNLPEHLFFFTRASLRGLLETHGLSVRRIGCETNWVPLAYAFERLAKSGLPLAPAACGVARHLPALRAQPLPVTLLDVLGIYATRPG